MDIEKTIASIWSFWVAPVEGLPTCIQGAEGDFNKILNECLLTDSYNASFALMIFYGVLMFVLSQVTGNDSWVDRSWSLTPITHAWCFALLDNKYEKFSDGHSGKAATFDGKTWTANMQYATIITLWGLRLTFNYWRKGGYSPGVEDYRWEHVRANGLFKIPVLGKIIWIVFHFTVLSLYQELILWMIVVPLYAVPPSAQPTVVDHFLTGAFLALLLWETIADQQQWNYQNEKREINGYKRRPELAADYERGFPSKGLFSRSRKPNVWAEIHLWVVICGASFFYKQGFNVSSLGFAMLALLLIPAGFLTESISASKYPQYKVYRRHVPMFFPRLTNPRPALEEAFAKAKAGSGKKKQ